MSAVFDARSGLAVPAPARPHGEGRADAAPEVISVTDLTVADPNGRPVLDGLTLTVRAGERVGVVGESGSGKTTLALALLGALRPGLRTAGGRVRVAGEDPLALRGRALRRLRRHTVAYLPQDPAAALTPTMRVGALVSELAVRRTPEDAARTLRSVGLPDGRGFLRRFPHELSGGQQQRLALGRVLAAGPAALVLDEPTTGLDVLTQRLVLDEVARLAAERNLTLLFITHDLPAAARLTDRLAVLKAGRVVEEGPVDAVLGRPRAAYTRELVHAVPDIGEAAARPAAPAGGAADTTPVLRVSGLRAGHGRGRARVTTAQDVAFHIEPGECVALLGGSGTGKTTLARCVTGHHSPDGGLIELAGSAVPGPLRGRTLDQRRLVQLVAQDANGSLNPRRTVGAAIARPLRVLRGLGGEAAAAETERLLRLVGLDPQWAGRLPRTLSGGQRQRVAIARALAAQPRLLLCDEVTSSLDVRIQAEILALLDGLRSRLGLGLLLISHDLGVIARMADRVLVLDGGTVREQGPVAEVFAAPRHPWTRAVLDAVPSVRGELAGRAERTPAADESRPRETAVDGV
ncbi:MULTISPECIES: ABC transporter ATP-binding protein [unclassified Streptomyces]|uniref:ABC transporter ATP-binding protein n=1 Tax=unclassified Streptomyces TaxID=2593676 RepID=UPI002DD8DBFD|nr:ABC transporter ATP-binding protein [Streptomyces sp. NBC_01445]WSE11706.1 ABC transporter ATP-binding protein [Streptomyces sp. NBC_01445]